MLDGKWSDIYKPLSYGWKETKPTVQYQRAAEVLEAWFYLYVYKQCNTFWEHLSFPLQFESQHLSRSSVPTIGKLRKFFAIFSLHTHACTAWQYL